MTASTRRILVQAHHDLHQFVRQLANPDVVTSTELEEMAHDLAAMALEMFEAARDIATDEAKEAACAS